MKRKTVVRSLFILFLVVLTLALIFVISIFTIAKKAQHGSAYSQRVLGNIYEVSQDYNESAKWYRLAAEQGDAEAQFSLGYMYDLGEGFPQDYSEALKWYRLSADQGYAGAQFNLGLMYNYGDGVPKDYKTSYILFNLAAANSTGDLQKKAAQKRDVVAINLSKQQLKEAQKAASDWKPKVKIKK